MGEKSATNPPKKVPTTEKEIERIGDTIKNARGTWFVLLGSLVFAAITLASVKDASFFITSEQTKLPLLGISVPITSFFWAGALLVTALYTYLHLYLVQLWDALGEADARIGDKPLADVIHPWLVSDAALRVRDKRRGDMRHRPAKRTWKNRWRRMRKGVRVRQKGFMKRFLRDYRVKRAEIMPQSSSQRGMSKIGNLVSVLLVWVLGLAVIIGFWWRSMPAHDIWLTGWLGGLLVWSLYVFWRSGSYALARLEEKQARFPAPIWFGVFALTVVGLTIVRTHYDRWEGYPRIDRPELTEGCTEHQLHKQKRTWCPYWLNLAQEFIRPARAEMSEVVFTQSPVGWTGFDLAKQEFRLRWCKQLGGNKCTINPLDETAQFYEKEEKKFETAWNRLRRATLVTFNKPDFRGMQLDGADFRFANLEGVKLEESKLRGADLSGAEMYGADLSYVEMQGARLLTTQMQGIELSFAKMQEVDLSGAEMQGAYLFGAEMQGASLRLTKMQSADLTRAQMQGIDLTGAELHGASLYGAEMQGAFLWYAQMQGAWLLDTQMQGADLSNTQMQGARIWNAQMQDANFSNAVLHGTQENTMVLDSTNLSGGNFKGTSLRFVDFAGAVVANLRNFEKSFGDGSVKLAGGMLKPVGWCEAVLSDAQYWGRYQGWWEEHDLEKTIDSDIKKHPLVPFSEPCPE